MYVLKNRGRVLVEHADADELMGKVREYLGEPDQYWAQDVRRGGGPWVPYTREMLDGGMLATYLDQGLCIWLTYMGGSAYALERAQENS